MRLYDEEKADVVDTAGIVAANALNRYLAEETAVTIRCYSGPNLPELLLTPACAQWIREFRFRHRSAIARMDAELLPRRQAVLGGSSPVQVLLVAGEESLPRLEAEKVDPQIVAAQLRRLREHASEQQVSVLIHPLTAPLRLESVDRFTITSDPAGRRIFDDLSWDSITEDRSLLRIDDALQQVRDRAGAAERGLARGG